MSGIHILNGRIEERFQERGATFVTVVYMEGEGKQREEKMVKLVVEPRTAILNENGAFDSADALRVGMTINAFISSAMTRSIPPQAVAYLIEIIERQPMENITTGRILEIDRTNRSFTTISDRDLSSIIRFNVSENTRIFSRSGRPIDFSSLRAGMQVRVRHANFMTASIPPQTSAFEIQVL